MTCDLVLDNDLNGGIGLLGVDASSVRSLIAAWINVGTEQIGNRLYAFDDHTDLLADDVIDCRRRL